VNIFIRGIRMNYNERRSKIVSHILAMYIVAAATTHYLRCYTASKMKFNRRTPNPAE